MKALQAWIKRVSAIPSVHFFVDVFQRFGEDNGAFYAAGLAFFMLLAFAPIILTGVAVLGFFINVHTATIKVEELIQNLLPSGGARDEASKFLSVQLHVEDQVRAVVRHRGVAGVFGFLSLIWATLQIFINAATAMNATWEVKETRNWFVQRGVALMLMVVTGCLLVLSLTLSGAPSAISHFHLPLIHRIPLPLPVLTVVFEVVALFLNTLMYVVIYKMLPNARVTWAAAAMGGVIASLLFEVAKKGVAEYLLRANHSIYGDLANLILFVLWIYYSMTILLLGAEFSAAYARKEGSLKPATTTAPVASGMTRGQRIKRSSRSGVRRH